MQTFIKGTKIILICLVLTGCCFSDPYRDEKVCHVEYGELVGPAGVEPTSYPLDRPIIGGGGRNRTPIMRVQVSCSPIELRPRFIGGDGRICTGVQKYSVQ